MAKETLRVRLADHPQLARPGGAVALKGPGVVLVRGKNKGTLRAFSNVCPHKPKKGRVKVYGPDCQLRCPVHDWTWGRKGQPKGKKAKKPLRELVALERAGEVLIELG